MSEVLPCRKPSATCWAIRGCLQIATNIRSRREPRRLPDEVGQVVQNDGHERHQILARRHCVEVSCRRLAASRQRHDRTCRSARLAHIRALATGGRGSSRPCRVASYRWTRTSGLLAASTSSNDWSLGVHEDPDDGRVDQFVSVTANDVAPTARGSGSRQPRCPCSSTRPRTAGSRPGRLARQRDLRGRRRTGSGTRRASPRHNRPRRRRRPCRAPRRRTVLKPLIASPTRSTSTGTVSVRSSSAPEAAPTGERALPAATAVTTAAGTRRRRTRETKGMVGATSSSWRVGSPRPRASTR